MVRKKTVFTTQQIPHEFVRGNRDCRNQQGNLFVDGDFIYSYGRHYEIARRLKIGKSDPDKKQLEIIVINDIPSSVTTTKHRSFVERACSHYVRFWYPLKNGEPVTPVQIRDYTIRNLKTSLKEFLKLPTRTTRKRLALVRKIEFLYHQVDQISRLANIARKVDYPEIPTEYGGLRIDECIRSMELDLRSREQPKREKQLQNTEKLLTAWESGERITAPHHTDTRFRLQSRTDDTTFIETSHGVQLPVADCEQAFRLLRVARERNNLSLERWSLDPIIIADWRIDSFDGEILKAGCHTVRWSMVEAFAKKMGWIDTPVTRQPAE